MGVQLKDSTPVFLDRFVNYNNMKLGEVGIIVDYGGNTTSQISCGKRVLKTSRGLVNLNDGTGFWENSHELNLPYYFNIRLLRPNESFVLTND